MDWNILQPVRVLDEGSYGIVLLARNKDTGATYAVKAGKLESADPRVLYQTLREVRVLRSLSPHPNVVSLVEAFKANGGHIYLAFELTHGGLHKELERLPNRTLPGHALKLVAWQLLRSLQHCHAHNVIHRDIKPANVLVSAPFFPASPHRAASAASGAEAPAAAGATAPSTGNADAAAGASPAGSSGGAPGASVTSAAAAGPHSTACSCSHGGPDAGLARPHTGAASGAAAQPQDAAACGDDEGGSDREPAAEGRARAPCGCGSPGAGGGGAAAQPACGGAAAAAAPTASTAAPAAAPTASTAAPAAAAAAAPLRVPVVKLCDFGFARPIKSAAPGHAEKQSSYVVTRFYRAPEVLVGAQYGTSVDIWSYGCTVAELATGRPLFPGNSTVDQLWRIGCCLGALPKRLTEALQRDLRLWPALAAAPPPPRGKTLDQRMPGIDPDLLQLITACLALEPSNRPSAAELLQMPYFADVAQLLAGTDLEVELGLATPAPAAAAVAAATATSTSAAAAVAAPACATGGSGAAAGSRLTPGRRAAATAATPPPLSQRSRSAAADSTATGSGASVRAAAPAPAVAAAAAAAAAGAAAAGEQEDAAAAAVAAAAVAPPQAPRTPAESGPSELQTPLPYTPLPPAPLQRLMLRQARAARGGRYERPSDARAADVSDAAADSPSTAASVAGANATVAMLRAAINADRRSGSSRKSANHALPAANDACKRGAGWMQHAASGVLSLGCSPVGAPPLRPLAGAPAGSSVPAASASALCTAACEGSSVGGQRLVIAQGAEIAARSPSHATDGGPAPAASAAAAAAAGGARGSRMAVHPVEGGGDGHHSKRRSALEALGFSLHRHKSARAITGGTAPTAAAAAAARAATLLTVPSTGREPAGARTSVDEAPGALQGLAPAPPPACTAAGRGGGGGLISRVLGRAASVRHALTQGAANAVDAPGAAAGHTAAGRQPQAPGSRSMGHPHLAAADATSPPMPAPGAKGKASAQRRATACGYVATADAAGGSMPRPASGPAATLAAAGAANASGSVHGGPGGSVNRRLKDAVTSASSGSGVNGGGGNAPPAPFRVSSLSNLLPRVRSSTLVRVLERYALTSSVRASLESTRSREASGDGMLHAPAHNAAQHQQHQPGARGSGERCRGRDGDARAASPAAAAAAAAESCRPLSEADARTSPHVLLPQPQASMPAHPSPQPRPQRAVRRLSFKRFAAHHQPQQQQDEAPHWLPPCSGPVRQMLAAQPSSPSPGVQQQQHERAAPSSLAATLRRGVKFLQRRLGFAGRGPHRKAHGPEGHAALAGLPGTYEAPRSHSSGDAAAPAAFASEGGRGGGGGSAGQRAALSASPFLSAQLPPALQRLIEAQGAPPGADAAAEEGQARAACADVPSPHYRGGDGGGCGAEESNGEGDDQLDEIEPDAIVMLDDAGGCAAVGVALPCGMLQVVCATDIAAARDVTAADVVRQQTSAASHATHPAVPPAVRAAAATDAASACEAAADGDEAGARVSQPDAAARRVVSSGAAAAPEVLKLQRLAISDVFSFLRN